MSSNISDTYVLDVSFFRKRIYLKYIVLSLINFGFLAYGYFPFEGDKSNYILSSAFVLFVIILLFTKSAKKQIDSLKTMSFVFSKNLLKHFGPNHSCTEIDLEKVQSLKMDSILGYKRFLVKSETGATHSYAGILEESNFIAQMEKISGRKFESLERNKWEFAIKFFLLFLPSIITYFLIYHTQLGMNNKIFFLIFNLNSMFFIHNLSEKKFEGGISDRLARRLIILLFIVFCFQFYSIFI